MKIISENFKNRKSKKQRFLKTNGKVQSKFLFIRKQISPLQRPVSGSQEVGQFLEQVDIEPNFKNRVCFSFQ